MQGKCNLDLRFCLSDEGFSLDELVVKLGELFESKGFPDILRLILMLMREMLVHRSVSGKDFPFECYGKREFKLNGAYERRLMTTLGAVSLPFWRMSCKSRRKGMVPLRDFLGLDKYLTKTGELERIVIDAVSDTSYRRAVREIEERRLIKLSHPTAHNWVMRTDCDEIKLSEEMVGSLGPTRVVADGTGFKGLPSDGKAARGDLKVVVGVNTSGEVFPLGSWTGVSWEEINDRWEKNKIKFPEGSVLVADGEPGLAEAFADRVDDARRCHWHVVRDLYHAMHHDGAPLKKTRELQKGLAGVLALELPEGEFEKVPETEKDEIEERMERADDLLGKLVDYLEGRGFTKAATYLDNARRSMFSYVRWWLRLGIARPRASSLIERVIRELGRRLKKLAYNWSDKGAAKISRIILKKFTNKDEWEAYWREKLGLTDDNVFLFVGNYKMSAQDLRH